MTSTTSLSGQSLYDKDFSLWLSTTAELLRQQRFHDIDLDNLIEEIESMGKSDRRSLVSFLERLLEHLLKVAYWESERERNLNHWLNEVDVFRAEIKRILKDSPSLKSYFSDSLAPAYEDVAKRMKARFKLDVPVDCPFTSEQILDVAWYPIEIPQDTDETDV